MILMGFTAFMGEYSLADGAGPHPQAAGELGLGMAGQVLPQGPLVDVVLSANRTRMVGGPPLRYVRISFHLCRIRRWRKRRRRRWYAKIAHGATTTTISRHWRVSGRGEVGWRVR